MSKGKAVICVVKAEQQAIDIVNRLQAAGFEPSAVSVLFPDRSGTHSFAHEHHTKAPEGAVAGATTGGLLGGALGWLAGIGALAIPGLGPFIAAGPIMAALGGAAVGAATGGLTGGLIGMGIPEFEAKRYAGRIESGNILIAVHSDDANETKLAKAVFEKCGAEDISTTGEASVDSATKQHVRG